MNFTLQKIQKLYSLNLKIFSLFTLGLLQPVNTHTHKEAGPAAIPGHRAQAVVLSNHRALSAVSSNMWGAANSTSRLGSRSWGCS